MEEEEPIFDYTILDDNEYNYVRNVNIMYDKQVKHRNEHGLRKMNFRTFQAKAQRANKELYQKYL